MIEANLLCDMWRKHFISQNISKKDPIRISSSRFARTTVAPLEIVSVELNPELQDTQFTCKPATLYCLDLNI